MRRTPHHHLVNKRPMTQDTKQTLPTEQPSTYYEKYSCMTAVLRPEQKEWTAQPGVLLQRIGSMPGVRALQMKNPAPAQENEPNLLIDYEGETYEMDFYPVLLNPMQKQMGARQTLDGKEQELLEKADTGIAVILKFGNDPFRSFHLQLKLINALAPGMPAVIDDSGEQTFSGRWVHSVAPQRFRRKPCHPCGGPSPDVRSRTFSQGAAVCLPLQRNLPDVYLGAVN